MNTRSPTVFTIDRQDKITSVNGQFWIFAGENRWSPPEQTVLGRSLWGFIGDPCARLVYQIVLDEIRIKGISVLFPFRCDSPTYTRHITMAMAPQRNGAVVISTEVDLEIAWPFAAPPPAPTRDLCHRCRSFQFNGEGMPVVAALSLHLVDVGRDTILSVLCRACQAEDQRNRIDDWNTRLVTAVAQK